MDPRWAGIGNSKGKLIAFDDIYSSADGENWVLENSKADWSPRGIILGGVAHRGCMWIIGGGTYDFRTFNHQSWNSKDGIRWNLVNRLAPWVSRQYHCVAVFDEKIWVFGGNSFGNEGSSDVWYSSDGIEWTELKDTPWSERHAASVVVSGNDLWLVGGSASKVYNDVWKLGRAV